MSTSEFLHLMIIFCILLRRNACILKQLSKTFQKSTFSSHLCSWVQDYGVLSLFPVRLVWCKGELKNWAPAVSGNERKWLQTPCGWDTGIMALPGLGSIQTLPAVEVSFQLWELVEVQWWKLGCWAPHSWVLGLVIPSSHSTPCHLQTAVPGAWPLLHRRTAAGKVTAHAEPVLKDNFLTIVPFFIVFSASSPRRSCICKGRYSMAGSP